MITLLGLKLFIEDKVLNKRRGVSLVVGMTTLSCWKNTRYIIKLLDISTTPTRSDKMQDFTIWAKILLMDGQKKVLMGNITFKTSLICRIQSYKPTLLKLPLPHKKKTCWDFVEYLFLKMIKHMERKKYVCILTIISFFIVCPISISKIFYLNRNKKIW